MTTKLFSLGSLEEGYEPLLEEDAIESFRMHDFSLKSYLDEFFPDQDYQLLAVPYVPPPPEPLAPQPSQPSEPEVTIPYRHRPGILTPYQLKLENSALFPEFYLHFKRSFANISHENRAYCSVDLERFKSFYVGNKQDIISSVIRVEQDFDSKFKECLHPDLLNEFSAYVFNRVYVETKFRDAMKNNVDHSSYPRRMDELIGKARSSSKNITPLLDFLMAYEYPESAIWFQVLLVYSRYFNSGKRKRFLNMKAEAWQRENAPLLRKIQGFVKDLSDEGMSEGKIAYIIIFTSLICFAIVGFTFLVISSGPHKKHGH